MRIIMCSSTIIEHKNKSVAKRLVCCSRFELIRDVVVDNMFHFMILNKVICYSFVIIVINYCMCV